jgi:hypothetical protein
MAQSEQAMLFHPDNLFQSVKNRSDGSLSFVFTCWKFLPGIEASTKVNAELEIKFGVGV